MISKPRRQITTAEQLWGLPDDGNRYELVNGVLHKMSPAGSEHGEIAGRILRRLGDHVERHGLGKTYAAETGFRIARSARNRLLAGRFPYRLRFHRSSRL
jgi:Uma2 family endonuclease